MIEKLFEEIFEQSVEEVLASLPNIIHVAALLYLSSTLTLKESLVILNKDFYRCLEKFLKPITDSLWSSEGWPENDRNLTERQGVLSN